MPATDVKRTGVQWQDACQVAAARYVPPLLLLAGGLLGAALPAVPAGAIAVIVIAAACLLLPVPAEVRVTLLPVPDVHSTCH